METDLSYDTIEQQQAADLPSEVDQFEPVIRHQYREYALQNATDADERPAMIRIKEMERKALDVYDEGLTNSEVPYNQRRQVADKVLEITGVIDKGKGGSDGGNTFVFGDSFADKFVAAAERIGSSLIKDVTADRTESAHE